MFPTGAELAEHVLKRSCEDAYTSSNLMGAYVPFAGDLMAEPPSDHGAVDMLAALPEDIGCKCVDIRRLLRPPEDVP